MVVIRSGEVVTAQPLWAKLNPMKLIDLIVLFFQTLMSPEPVAAIRARNARRAQGQPERRRPPPAPAPRNPNVRTLGDGGPGGTPNCMPGGG
mmetsp:Transcript_1017/g.3193  ORF Transcript_1017/g.3193 Transcript_1017/m.3193 type:complete len:92 (-) Transcript_1017:589-864(-)